MTMDTNGGCNALTLSQYAALIRNLVARDTNLRERWVTAELSDVRVANHCYMDLIEKDASGRTIAKIRATLWSNRYYLLNAKFRAATGANLQSGIKVMLRGSAIYHEQYGMSFNISDIDPRYTLGDMEQLRREILERLQKEGLLKLNGTRTMPLAPQRIAVISAAGAAGYGDFLNQLGGNPYGLVFYPVLFEATMQGERTAPTVISALRHIEMVADAFDCVVIIRGGGATTDLNGFDNLELARAVARCVLPVIVGIGHERDRTVLDEIAHTRVKTPTAAAEWLISHAADTLARIETLTRDIAGLAQSIISGSREHLSQLETRLHTTARQGLSNASQRLASIESLIPQLSRHCLQNAAQRLDNIVHRLPDAGRATLRLQRQKLDYFQQNLCSAATSGLQNATQRLDNIARLVKAYSPQATLARGYSLTLVNGHAVTDASQLSPGTSLTTRLAKGEFTSTVTAIENNI